MSRLFPKYENRRKHFKFLNFMKKVSFVILVALMLSGFVGKAQNYPDISGLWKTSAGELYSFSQDGAKVSCFFNNTNFDHTADGKFVNKNTIRMTLTRKNKTNNCVTYMKITIILNDFGDEMSSFTWESMDSNCDLKSGQTATFKAFKQ